MKNIRELRKPKSSRTCMLLCLLFVISLWAPSMRAQISLSLKQATLGQAFAAIQKQGDYHFFYEDRLVNLPVKEVQVKNKTLKETLDVLLSGQNVSYTIEDNIVYFSPENKKTATETPQPGRLTITGTVVDENREPMIGVNVLVKGATEGTTTDVNGRYSLSGLSAGSRLQFSYVGYLMQTVTVGNQTVLDVVLKEDLQQLGEVVVTALGIKREKRLLGYSIQELKADELNRTGNASVSGALQGKIAGVQMNIAPTGLNGSTKITIRGNSSLSDNNQPLWVIDGIPYGDNSDSNVSLYGGIDRGGASVDINPEDIESISVLKGPNSAALYGSRAGNGVILITTKRGARDKGFGVNYNSTFTWTKVAETLDMQTTYGQGLNGVYNAGTPFSYGAKLDGSKTPAWWEGSNGASLPYQYQGNKLKDYFSTGFAQNHNLSIGSASDDMHYRLSFGYLDNKGLFDGEGLEKYNIDLHSGKKFNKYLSMDSKISLSKTRANNRPYNGKYGEMFQLMYLPNNISLDDLKTHYTRQETDLSGKEYGVHQNWIGPTQDIMNPYWINKRRTNMDERWRVFGYHSIQVNFTDWLYATGKWSMDYFRTSINEIDRGLGGNVEDLVKNDVFYKSENNFMEMNTEFMIRGNNNIGEKIRVDYGFGGNRMDTRSEILSAAARNLANKDVWYLNNAGLNLTEGIPTYANQSLSKKRVNSLYGMFQIAYNDYLSLDITDRNDWSSTLKEAYNYPSFNLSFVGTEFLNKMDIQAPKWLTYGKLRASYAKAGKDTEAYALQNYRKYEQGFTGPNYIVDNVFVDDLKPEMNTSFETGLEMKFLQNRLGFDFTWYNSVTQNQIMRIPNVSGTDWKERRINAGKILNRGVEFSLYAIPVKTKDFEFGLDLNLSHNVTTVEELHPVMKYVDLGDDHFFFMLGALEGGKLGDIYATRVIKRDDKGNMIINKYTGLPQLDGSKERKDRVIGNIQPNLLMSVTPHINYKNISLSALIDMKFGGDIVSVSDAIATHYGTSKRTENRNEKVILPGVYEDGAPNTTEIRYEDYYRFIGNAGTDAGVAEEFVFDASYIRFRELSLGYSVNRKLLDKTPFNALKLSFVARNLCYFLKHTPGTNPEGGFDITMYSQAFDYLAVPDTRTLGFSINIGF